jgi:hypothetical protein
MAVLQSNVALAGLTPTVTQNGFCNDGCIGFGQFDITSKSKYKRLSVLPFKAIMDDTHFFDSSKNVFYTQASYDLRYVCDRSPCQFSWHPKVPQFSFALLPGTTPIFLV